MPNFCAFISNFIAILLQINTKSVQIRENAEFYSLTDSILIETSSKATNLYLFLIFDLCISVCESTTIIFFYPFLFWAHVIHKRLDFQIIISFISAQRKT